MSKKFMESPDSNPKVSLKRKGSAIKAIIMALLVDCIGLYILGFIVFLMVSFILILTGTEASLDQIGYKMIEIGTSMGGAEPLFQNDMISSQNNETSSINNETSLPLKELMILVLIFHVLGGYLCARIASHYEYRYSAIVGFFACTFWVIMNLDKNSVIENVICTVLIFIAGLFGAWIYVSDKTNKRMKPTTNNHAV